MERLASICSFLLVEVSVGIDEQGANSYLTTLRGRLIKKAWISLNVQISLNKRKAPLFKKKNGTLYVYIEKFVIIQPY